MSKGDKNFESLKLRAAQLDNVLSRSASAAISFIIFGLIALFTKLFSPSFGQEIQILSLSIISLNLIRIIIQYQCKKNNVGLENYLKAFITITALNGLFWGFNLALAVSDSTASPTALLLAFVMYVGLMNASSFSLGSNKQIHLGYIAGMFLPMMGAVSFRYYESLDPIFIFLNIITLINALYTLVQGRKYRLHFKEKWLVDEELFKSQQEVINERAINEHLNRISSIGEMAAGLAHEINNPLAIVIGNLEILEMELNDKNVLDQDTKTIIKKAVNSASRITRIIKILRSLSVGSSEEGRKLTHIRTIVDDSLVLLQERILSNEIKLELKIANDLHLFCDSIQIEQVLINLLNNACDALESQPELNNKWIEVEAKSKENNIVINVSNNGTVITHDIIKKLFTPFFTTKPVGQGMGLGLVISRSIAVQHGGNLEASNNLGHTCFTLKIPLKA